MTPGGRPPLVPLREDWQRAMCVAAHPDDLEYGAASAVARWTRQGKTVTYLLATRGEAGIDATPPAEAGPVREQEERAGALEVGVDVVDFLDHRDGVVEHGLPLRRDIAREIRRRRPDVVIGCAFTERGAGRVTNQADHRAVGLAVLDAARDAGNRWVFPELVDEGFEPWPEVRFVAFAGSPEPTHGVDVTETLHQGIASLKAHSGYMAGLGARAFDPADLLTPAAVSHGARLGVVHGVSFDVYELVAGSATGGGA